MTQVAPVFNQLETYINDARARVADGLDIDLHGLDAQIEALCDLVLSLEKEDQRLYEERLQDLLGGLNSLGIELRERENLKDIAVHRNASVAYKTADSRDNFGKRDEDK